MPENTSFEEWINSPYYHLLYNSFDIARVGFIGKLINKLKPGDDNKILHAGCGLGRYSATTAETGLDVTGVDISFETIDHAKQLENERLHFYQHDLRLPFWINYFDYAFHLFTPFAYYKTARENSNAIRTIAQSLQANGLVVIDCISAQYEQDRLEKTFEQTVGEVGFTITAWQDDAYFYKNIEVRDPGVGHQVFTEKIMKFSFENCIGMFARQGLEMQEVFGDYNFSAYDTTQSPRLIIIAKKLKK